MTLSSELFNVRSLISRTWYRVPLVSSAGAEVAYSITAPAKTTVGRVSMVGSGGWSTRSVSYSQRAGGGAAFARTKFSAVADEAFTAYVGNPYLNISNHTTGVPNGDGSSRFIRNTGSVLLCKAAASFGLAGSYGLASGSVGDTTRNGNPAERGDLSGAPGDDEEDTYSLGFKAMPAGENGRMMVGHGVGGIGRYSMYTDESFSWEIVPGCGLICVEWFTEDPGY